MGDNMKVKFSVKLVIFTENLVKAFAMTIPFLHGVYELELYRNQISDIMSAVIVFAVFANPGIQRFSMVGNPVRTTFNKTFRLM